MFSRFLAIVKLVFVCLIFYANNSSAQEIYAADLESLNNIIKQKSVYDSEKQNRINKLETSVKKLTLKEAEHNYHIYLALYNEYKTFDFNKAFYYSQKLEEAGRLQNDPVKIAYGKTKMGFILLSSGMFKETFDALQSVDVHFLSDSMKVEYYFLTARSYYDLADYDKDNHFAPSYIAKAENYIDSATRLCSPISYTYQYYTGLKLLKKGDIIRASEILNNLLKSKLSYHEFAVTASTLSDIYIQQQHNEAAIQLLAKAAIADIKSSTKEAAAMLNLAQLLYQKKDVKNAYVYINQAMDDANYYGARQRKVQVSAHLMVIAGGKVNSVEEQRKTLIFYVLILAFLIIMIVIFAFISYRQLVKLRKADKVIVETNASLQKTIHQLSEAEKIKEEYIGYYFNLISVYINKLEKFKRSVDNKINTKRFEDIHILVNNINLKKEREELFENFDRAFLTLFPNFVEAYNTLFEEENKIKLQPGQLLNTDLRIFALVRLGIHDTEKIAAILEYSMNTIYNYRTRIKTKSILPNDDFEQAIMSIKAI